MKRTLLLALAAALAAALTAHAVSAQHPAMPHAAMPPGAAPTEPGQAAFAALAEVVRLLDADPATDWSRVSLERLRQHLIDMNEVVLRARVSARPVDGGLVMDVTGEGRTARALDAMLRPHAAELERMEAYAARAEPIPGGPHHLALARGELVGGHGR